jgi:hypothetical protein
MRHPKFIKPGVNALDLEFNRYGLLNGEVQISFNALSSHILQVPAPIQLSLDKFEPHLSHLSFSVDNLIEHGSTVKIEVVCQQGNYTFRDTLTRQGQISLPWLLIMETTCPNGISPTVKIGILLRQPINQDRYALRIAPSGEYEPNSEEALVLSQLVDLTKATSAYAQFWAKWDIEDHYDYVVFQASTDGENW